MSNSNISNSASENFPVDNNYTKPPKKDYRNIIYALLTLGLLGSLGYIWYSKKNEKDRDAQQEKQLVETSQQRDNFDNMYKTALDSLASITNLNTSLNAEITNKDGNVSRLKGEIEALLRQKAKDGKLNDQEEATLRNKIAQLNKEIESYKGRVAELEKQNQDLTNENTIVKTERDSITNELGNTKSNLEKTQTVKKELENQVDVGSTLTANNFTIAGVNEKRRGKEKETDKAKKVDKLRIGFDLDANRITPSGKKTIYVSITAPDGSPVTVEALGSGKFTTREEGEKFFTNSIEVDYTQGQKKNINFDWKQNSDFQIGEYKVEVYQNGFKIGQGKVNFRKGGGLFG